MNDWHPSTLWTPLANVQLERELWVRVMKVQRDLGLYIPAFAIEASSKLPSADLATMDKIHQRELKTRHDLKARLEVFCEEAGHEFHHLGLTSADIVDNVTQIRMLRSMTWLAEEHGFLLPSLNRYSFRGIKGAVGTQQDILDLLGSLEACLELDQKLADFYGFAHAMDSVGQVYPRSQDVEVLTELINLPGLRPSTVATITGAIQSLLGVTWQWNEGDVSSSVVRRYWLPLVWLTLASDLGSRTDV